MSSSYQSTKYPGIYKRGKKYVVKQRDGGGRMIARSADTIAEARAIQTQLRNMRLEGRRIGKPILFSTYADEWIKTYPGRTGRGLRDTTRAGYKDCLENEAKPFFGKMTLQQIQPRDIKAFVAILAERGLRPKSVTRYVSVVKVLLATAFEDGIIMVNPAANVRTVTPREYQEEPSNKSLSDSQLERLIEVVDPKWLPFMELLAHTGMRIGEATALRWKDVNLTAKKIRVERGVNKGVISEPKSRYGKRTIPLSPRLITVLTLHRESCRDASPETPVFATSGGKMIDPHNFRSRIMRPAAAAAGVPWATPHTLRHTFASRCFRNGCNLKQVQAMLGHHSPAFTLEVYVHMLPEDLPDLGFLG